MKPAYEGQGRTADRGFTEDGRRLWVFSQSRLKQVDVCPERGRRALLDLMPDFPTDSTAMGHAVHEVIELCLADIIEGMGPWRLDDMTQCATALFDEEMADPSAQWVKFKRASSLHEKIATCLSTWYRLVLPTLDPLAVEVNFGPLTIHEDDERVIQVQGQIDYVDKAAGLADWKTAGREWEEWEHQRWDIQPTLYTLGQYQCCADTENHPHPWTWHVLNTDGSYQKITTTRSHADWAWLKHRCLVIAKQLEAELPEWLKNDTTALCSPKWCGAWAECKGAFVGLDWPHKP